MHPTLRDGPPACIRNGLIRDRSNPDIRLKCLQEWVNEGAPPNLAAFGLVLLFNLKTIRMFFIVVELAASHPFTERVTHRPQAVLGLVFGMVVFLALLLDSLVTF